MCTFTLQRLALRTSRVKFPGHHGTARRRRYLQHHSRQAAAAGAAVQFRMLTARGIDTDVAVGGLTAFSLLGVGALLALPIFALPAILLFGSPVSRRGLAQAAFIGGRWLRAVRRLWCDDHGDGPTAGGQWPVG